MKNIGIPRVLKSGVDDFTTDFGMDFRNKIKKPLKFVLKAATKGNIIIECERHLEDDEAYIFTSTHYFSEDIIAALASIKKNAYALIGATDQIETNPQMYAAWLNGIIYVNRWDKQSRKDSVEKMERVLNHGNSVLIYPEGGWNNTENLLCQEFFKGPHILSARTNCKVVPVSQYFKEETNDIYIWFGKPIELNKYNEQEGIRLLRDTMASNLYEMIESYSIPLKRDELPYDVHTPFMESRVREYFKQAWNNPYQIVDDELTRYSDKKHPRYEEIVKSQKNIKIDASNAKFFKDLLKEFYYFEQTDFKKFLTGELQNPNSELIPEKSKQKIKRMNEKK